MTDENRVSLLERVATLVVMLAAAALLAMGWVTTALAQADSGGDGFDGDELSVPILLGIGVLAYAGWLVYRRRAAKSRD
jgi:ACR3 family arsenite efflux pump ArsB